MPHERAEETAAQAVIPRGLIDVGDHLIEQFPRLDRGEFVDDAIVPPKKRELLHALRHDRGFLFHDR